MIDAPSNIRAHQPEQILELVWEDGLNARLAYRTLRTACPCASCRDEWTGKLLLDPNTIRADLKIEAMEPVGNYAVRLAWNDGHGSGLFTWEMLHRLASESPS
jgi:DUF971 family protein